MYLKARGPVDCSCYGTFHCEENFSHKSKQNGLTVKTRIYV